MDNKAKIGRILEDGGLHHWGVASFADTLPVLPLALHPGCLGMRSQ